MSLPTVFQVGSTVLGLYALHLALDFKKAVDSIGNHPGYRVILPINGVVTSLSRQIPGVSIGEHEEMLQKHDYFASVGWDVIAAVSILPRARVLFKMADAEFIKEVTTSRARFPKDVNVYSVLRFFGDNIVASEGEEWKRMRKIVAPAFSDRNNNFVWDETLKIVQSLFTDVWGDQERITVDHAVDITLPIALSVIGVAGEFRFGRGISWKDEKNEVFPEGHCMSFKEALHIVSKDTLIKIITPSFLVPWFKKTRTVDTAFKELELYMVEMIRARKSGATKNEERHDLFTALLDANEEEDLVDGAATLSERELLGNVFIIQLAGHETTAHTLCFTFALLAFYPDEQDKLYRHIMGVLRDVDRLPGYEEMPLFTQSMAVFYETLRMFPPVPAIPKVSLEDTVLTTSNAAGERKTILIPKGASLVISTPGLHYNPRYWEDPYTFKPERFLGDWPRDAFMPFSAGARACVGRKFFETEGIAILTKFVSQYKISIKEEPMFAHETRQQTWDRVFETKPRMSLTPVRVPLVFTRR